MSSMLSVSRPPRQLPWSTRLVLLFGGFFSAFGWFFFGFGMIFVWTFAVNGDYSSIFVMRGKLETASAEVTQIDKTSYSEGGRKGRSGTPIYAYHYKFAVDGIGYEGTSFRTGKGDHTTVEFPSGRPDRSRIRGMRRAIFGPSVGFVFIFPAFGLVVISIGFWNGWKNIGLLTNGEMAEGRLAHKAPTNAKVNKKTVYELTFKFCDSQGQMRQTSAKTHLPEKLEDGNTEILFYDRNNPGKAALLDNLPGSLELTNQGEIKPRSFTSVIGILLPPLVASSVVVGGLLMKYLWK